LSEDTFRRAPNLLQTPNYYHEIFIWDDIVSDMLEKKIRFTRVHEPMLATCPQIKLHLVKRERQ